MLTDLKTLWCHVQRFLCMVPNSPVPRHFLLHHYLQKMFQFGPVYKMKLIKTNKKKTKTTPASSKILSFLPNILKFQLLLIIISSSHPYHLSYQSYLIIFCFQSETEKAFSSPSICTSWSLFYFSMMHYLVKKKKPLYHKTHVNYCTRKGVPFPVLPPLFASSPWDDTDTDIENGWVKNPEVCERDERKLPASMSSSEPKWWHSTRSTKSSFSLQVSVGMFLRTRYWRRSLTFSLISCGRWNAVSCSKWQVEHLRRFSCKTEQTEQKSFLQSQHTC